MTLTANPPVEIVPDRDPRDPELRLTKLLDPGSLVPLHVRDDSGVYAVRGTIGGALVTAFASDPLALGVASRAILNGFDGLFPDLRGFFYLPFEHSENLADQEKGVAFYKAVGDVDGVKWAEIHADIIRRFDRFPHRNAVLGRVSTPEEQKFLDDGGFAG